MEIMIHRVRAKERIQNHEITKDDGDWFWEIVTGVTFKSLSNAIATTLEGFATLHNVLDVKKEKKKKKKKKRKEAHGSWFCC